MTASKTFEKLIADHDFSAIPRREAKRIRAQLLTFFEAGQRSRDKEIDDLEGTVCAGHDGLCWQADEDGRWFFLLGACNICRKILGRKPKEAT